MNDDDDDVVIPSFFPFFFSRGALSLLDRGLSYKMLTPLPYIPKVHILVQSRGETLSPFSPLRSTAHYI